MDFYQVAITLADFRGWGRQQLAREVGIEYNNIRNWGRRKSTCPADILPICRGLGISPSCLAMAASLNDELMDAEIKAFVGSSSAIASPTIEWALDHYQTIENIQRAIREGHNALQRLYIRKICDRTKTAET